MKKYARLRKYYEKTYINELKKELNIENIMKVPKIEKICVSSSISVNKNNSGNVEKIYDDIICITGQKLTITKSKKSISGFNLRKGMSIGCKVTLRKNIMYEFLDRMINIALPRIKDFRGIKESQFDGNGNISIGVKEQIIFPEIDYNKIDKIRGMMIVIVTSTNNNEEAKFLLKTFKLPFYN
jgi:large subunit ribosomal protein L5